MKINKKIKKLIVTSSTSHASYIVDQFVMAIMTDEGVRKKLVTYIDKNMKNSKARL